jgi:hypothetical protein
VIQSPKCTYFTVGKAGAEQSLSSPAILTTFAKQKRNEMREMNDTKHANKAREASRKNPL